MSSLFGNLGSQPSQPTSNVFGSNNSAQTGNSFGGSTLLGSQPSPFSNSASASTSQPSGGLFGAAPSQPQQQQGSSLFPPAYSAAQGSSLFGNTQGGGSLFGNTQQQQQQQQQQQGGTLGSSLFGNTQQQQTGSSGTSLFGNRQTTGSSLFGAQPAQQPSMFNTTQAQNPQQQSEFQRGFANSQNPPNQSGKNEEPKAAFFDSLLEKGRKRKIGDSSLDGLPSIELGLGDIRQRLRTVQSGGKGTASAGPAHYLLRGSGVDPIETDLSFFESQATTKPRTETRTETSSVTDTDVDSYLANLQTQTTLSMIADGLARSVQDFDAFVEDNVTMEWDAQKKRIYDHFGIKPRDDSNGLNASFGGSNFGRSAFGRTSRQSKGPSLGMSQAPGASTFARSGLQRSVIGTPGPIGLGQSTNLFSDVAKQKEESGASARTGPEIHFLQKRQKDFIEVVKSFNRERLRKRSHPVISELANITAETGDQQSQNVADAYEAVKLMVGEASEGLSGTAKKEREFSHAYLNEAHIAATTVPIKKTILTGANKYLEVKFWQGLEAQIDKQPREARMGGHPSVINKVKAYIRVLEAFKNLFPDDETLLSLQNGDYPWAIVFFLIRSGRIKEAADYVEDQIDVFKNVDRYFSTYIQDYANSPDRRLSRHLQERINNAYNQLYRVAPDRSVDPYKLACYKIIGRCDLDNRKLDGLVPNIGDFIWLQFNLAREVSRVNEMATEVYGLDEVRIAISEIGGRHFTTKNLSEKSNVYGMYFYLQVLCGRFEQAVAYLYPFNHVDAVHFAIALSYYGLLRVSAPGSTTDLLSFSTRQEPQLNFGLMVAYYTRDFRAADVVAAVDYIALICLNADLPGESGRQQSDLCHEALRELILESREFAELLGDIRHDGQCTPGAIAERMPLIGLNQGDDFLRDVTMSAASVADESGRVVDAVLLYHLAQEWDRVLTIINRALSEAINIDLDSDPLRLQPLKPRDDETSREPEGSSLSLTSVDDPAELAKIILRLYTSNQVQFKISAELRNNCEVLLQMNKAKKEVQEGKWANALDTIKQLQIIPLNGGSVRDAATKFGTLPLTIARNVPCLILWSLGCINQERERLETAAYGQNAQSARERLIGSSKDLLVFAGAIRYHMPQHVYDTMSRLSQWSH